MSCLFGSCQDVGCRNLPLSNRHSRSLGGYHQRLPTAGSRLPETGNAASNSFDWRAKTTFYLWHKKGDSMNAEFQLCSADQESTALSWRYRQEDWKLLYWHGVVRLWCICACGCLLRNPTAIWDKSQAQWGLEKWPATAMSSGDSPWQSVLCQCLRAKGLHLQPQPQPGIAHHLVC